MTAVGPRPAVHGPTATDVGPKTLLLLGFSCSCLPLLHCTWYSFIFMFLTFVTVATALHYTIASLQGKTFRRAKTKPARSREPHEPLATTADDHYDPWLVHVVLMLLTMLTVPAVYGFLLNGINPPVHTVMASCTQGLTPSQSLASYRLFLKSLT